jgi:parallel beta-helix repeat protein/predicted outer membrane repeat protein
MKKVLSFTLFGLWMVIGSAYATEIDPGPVSGDWYASGNPYNINGDISVDSTTTLNIHESVEVIFQGYYQLYVYGTLQAIGTESDSILFTPADTLLGWRNIRFQGSNTGNILSYCIIQYGYGGGVYLGGGATATINHSTLRWNYEDYGGGAIVLWEASSLTLESCLITENTAALTGGGLCIWENSYLRMDNCIISNNSTAYLGGGIAIYDSRGDISNCLFSGNEVYDLGNGGGGLYCMIVGCDVTFSNCTFSNNSAATLGGGVHCREDACASFFNCSFNGNYAGYSGGGVYLYYSDNIILDHCLIEDNTAGINGGGFRIYSANYPSIKNCTVVNNAAISGTGGGISIYSSSPEIVNTIIEGNEGSGGLYFDDLTPMNITYCDIANNLPENLMGSVPVGLGELVGVNVCGDSCDIHMNIFLDPLFEDPGNGNYQITWANYPMNDSTRSPCIDAGDPASPLDPDSTLADIGCYYFDQGTPWVGDYPKLPQPSEFLLYPNYPNPFNASTMIRYSLAQSGMVTLTIHNVLGQKVARLFASRQQAGYHKITWDASGVASGVYFAQLQSDNHLKCIKLVVLK